MECSLPNDGRRVPLSQLSQDSFRECQLTLTLTDFFIIIFSGISVSVAAIMASFFLASTVHCFQRWSKGSKGDEEENEEWGWGLPLTWFRAADMDMKELKRRDWTDTCKTSTEMEWTGEMVTGQDLKLDMMDFW